MPFLATWMDLDIVILIEVSQTKTRSYNITYMWNLKYDTSELTYKTETDSQTQRKDLLPRRRRLEEGWVGSLGLVDANYYIQTG